jgi:hypothetical protein
MSDAGDPSPLRERGRGEGVAWSIIARLPSPSPGPASLALRRATLSLKGEGFAVDET